MKTKIDRNELYRFLIKQGLFTRNELELITDLLPNTIETLEKAIYFRFGIGSYEATIQDFLEYNDKEIVEIKEETK
jgi:hypothetical protein